jgi:hypothetical protein
MSGYLRRLARRALGTEIAVHSAAALPFAELPAVLEAEPTLDTAGSVTRPSAEPTSVPVARPAPGAEGVRLTAVTPAVAEATPERLPPLRRRPSVPTLSPLRDEGAEPASGPGFTELVFVPLVREPRSEKETSRHAVPRHPAVETEAPAPPTSRRSTSQAGVRPSLPRAGHGVDLGVRSVPEPEPTEVNVHIGRIEVTAVPAQPAPKRVQRERPKPMSLSEYLQRRRGSGR